MSCVLRVHNQETTPQIVIPNKAIVEQMGEYFVYIAKDTVLPSHADSTGKGGAPEQAGPKQVAMQVRVETGQTVGPNIIIQSGLNDGDRVVVDGVQALHDGAPITTAAPKQPGGKGKGNKQESASNQAH
jgi:membrane fusion protein (multidrug efflux system)